MRLRSLVAATGLLFSACSLSWDEDPLTNGDCGEGTKACAEECVRVDNPATGCARPGCASCALANALAVCNTAGECVVSVCVGRFKDCDDDGIDCEIDTGHDPLNCGQCNRVCVSPPNGIPGCSAGMCTLGGCLPGFGSCDGNAANGCETDVMSSTQHCGKCNSPCATGQTCVNGSCV